MCKLETNWTPNCLASVADVYTVHACLVFVSATGAAANIISGYNVCKEESDTLFILNKFMVMVANFIHGTI